MTKKEVQHFNQRCAEFLGKDVGHDNMVIKNGNWTLMRYDSDWNWIMEIVEAIEELKFNSDTCTNASPCFTIGRHWCYIHINNDIKNGVPISGKYYYWSSGQTSVMGKNKKEAILKAIDQFLIWYEQHKTNKL